MKYLKTFESDISPKLGEYVVCYECETDVISEVKQFTSNNIGVIRNIKNINYYSYPYMVEYTNIPYNINTYFRDCIRGMSLENIIFHSENKEDAEMFIASNKYNL